MALTKVSTAVVDMSGSTGALEIAKGTTATRPATPSLGTLRANTTDHTMEVYNSTGWQALKEGGNAIILPLTVNFLVVAGGGGGGGLGGGGGAGGLQSSFGVNSSGRNTAALNNQTLVAGTAYNVTIGAAGNNGGYGPTFNGTNGGNSVFTGTTTITAIGGGFGSSYNRPPSAGGCGGGGSHVHYVPGAAGTAGQGYNGGNAVNGAPYSAACGGGTGAVGNPYNGASGGTGGSGMQNAITGTNTYYGGGGGGGSYSSEGGSPVAGGLGGGGVGNNANYGGAGAANKGGGGGGGGYSGSTPSQGGVGGTGVIILRYPKSYAIAKTGSLISTTAIVGTDNVTICESGTGTITFS